MLGSPVVRVGFVTQLLWDRYGSFWRDLVAGAGAEAALPEPAAVKQAFEQLPAEAAPTASFRLALAQASALSDMDLLVLPRLNPEGTSERGGGADRWIADLPGALVDALPSGARSFAVPAYPDEAIETIAIELLSHLVPATMEVGRVWARFRARAEAQAQGRSATRARAGADRAAVRALARGDALLYVAQPWVMTTEVAARLSADDRVLTQLAVDPAKAREEGWRFDEKLLHTDAEVIGAARLLSRRSGVGQVRMIVDEGSASDAWLARRVQQVSRRPFEAVPWQTALGSDDAFAALYDVPVH